MPQRSFSRTLHNPYTVVRIPDVDGEDGAVAWCRETRGGMGTLITIGSGRMVPLCLMGAATWLPFRV